MAGEDKDSRPWHGTTRKRQEPLYDEDVATPSHAERGLTLANARSFGTLSTMSCEHEGFPHGSLVTLAWDGGAPVFLISRLAEHTRNLEQESKASLLVAEADEGNPLALGRCTILGHCRIIEDDETRARAREAFLERHPQAKHYIDYGDFNLWRLNPERVRYIGGFGRMSWVEGEAWLGAQTDPLHDAAKGIIDHMNEDHRDAMATMCRAFTRATAAEQVEMTGVDRYGFEMSVETEEGWRPIRLAFDKEVEDGIGVRKAMVDLVGRAREKLADKT